MNKATFLILTALLLTTTPVFADQSILQMREDSMVGVKLNSPLTFKMKAPIVPDVYYSLENEIFWQKGIRVSKKDIVADAAFCSMTASSMSTMMKTADKTLASGNLLVSSVNGRVSDEKRMSTHIGLDTAVDKDIDVTDFRCESAVGELKETTVDEVKLITGGAVEIVETYSFSNSEDALVISQMLVENKEGVTQFKKAHKIGPIIEKATYETLSETHTSRMQTTTVVKYTITSRDCLGTDACSGMIIWTVTATIQSDGYSWDTVYKNEVIKK